MERERERERERKKRILNNVTRLWNILNSPLQLILFILASVLRS